MTEQEKLEMQREYCRKGIMKASHAWVPSDDQIDRMVREVVPDPPKPREIELNGGTGWYRVVEGRLQFRVSSSDEWGSATVFTAERIRALHDLLERPNE